MATKMTAVMNRISPDGQKAAIVMPKPKEMEHKYRVFRSRKHEVSNFFPPINSPLSFTMFCSIIYAGRQKCYS